MKVVFDTSVLVRIMASHSGLLGLKTAVGHGLIIVTSDYLLDELERTLRRRFGSTKQRAHRATRAFAKLAEVVVVAPGAIKKLSRDPSDDPVIVAAILADANVLISSDFDLLEVKNVGTLKIISYREFVEQLPGWLH